MPNQISFDAKQHFTAESLNCLLCTFDSGSLHRALRKQFKSHEISNPVVIKDVAFTQDHLAIILHTNLCEAIIIMDRLSPNKTVQPDCKTTLQLEYFLCNMRRGVVLGLPHNLVAQLDHNTLLLKFIHVQLGGGFVVCFFLLVDDKGKVYLWVYDIVTTSWHMYACISLCDDTSLITSVAVAVDEDEATISFLWNESSPSHIVQPSSGDRVRFCKLELGPSSVPTATPTSTSRPSSSSSSSHILRCSCPVTVLRHTTTPVIAMYGNSHNHNHNHNGSSNNNDSNKNAMSEYTGNTLFIGFWIVTVDELLFYDPHTGTMAFSSKWPVMECDGGRRRIINGCAGTTTTNTTTTNTTTSSTTSSSHDDNNKLYLFTTDGFVLEASIDYINGNVYGNDMKRKWSLVIRVIAKCPVTANKTTTTTFTFTSTFSGIEVNGNDNGNGVSVPEHHHHRHLDITVLSYDSYDSSHTSALIIIQTPAGIFSIRRDHHHNNNNKSDNLLPVVSILTTAVNEVESVHGYGLSGSIDLSSIRFCTTPILTRTTTTKYPLSRNTNDNSSHINTSSSSNGCCTCTTSMGLSSSSVLMLFDSSSVLQLDLNNNTTTDVTGHNHSHSHSHSSSSSYRRRSNNIRTSLPSSLDIYASLIESVLTNSSSCSSNLFPMIPHPRQYSEQQQQAISMSMSKKPGVVFRRRRRRHIRIRNDKDNGNGNGNVDGIAECDEGKEPTMITMTMATTSPLTASGNNNGKDHYNDNDSDNEGPEVSWIWTMSMELRTCPVLVLIPSSSPLSSSSSTSPSSSSSSSLSSLISSTTNTNIDEDKYVLLSEDRDRDRDEGIDDNDKNWDWEIEPFGLQSLVSSLRKYFLSDFSYISGILSSALSSGGRGGDRDSCGSGGIVEKKNGEDDEDEGDAFLSLMTTANDLLQTCPEDLTPFLTAMDALIASCEDTPPPPSPTDTIANNTINNIIPTAVDNDNDHHQQQSYLSGQLLRRCLDTFSSVWLDDTTALALDRRQQRALFQLEMAVGGKSLVRVAQRLQRWGRWRDLVALAARLSGDRECTEVITAPITASPPPHLPSSMTHHTNGEVLFSDAKMIDNDNDNDIDKGIKNEEESESGSVAVTVFFLALREVLLRLGGSVLPNNSDTNTNTNTNITHSMMMSDAVRFLISHRPRGVQRHHVMQSFSEVSSSLALLSSQRQGQREEMCGSGSGGLRVKDLRVCFLAFSSQ